MDKKRVISIIVAAITVLSMTAWLVPSTIFTPPSERAVEPVIQGVPLIGGAITMQITSSVFNNNETIPEKYTCDGQDINPPLSISGVPPEAKTLVLVMDDLMLLLERGRIGLHGTYQYTLQKLMPEVFCRMVLSKA